MATSIDMFAYLAAFVSIILALAVSDLVQSFHRLLRSRRNVKWSLTALIAASTVFMAILEEFFGLWRFTGVERFTYFDLLTLIVPAILLSIAAMTVLPDEVPEQGLDLAQYYMDNRRLLYLLQALWVFGVFVRLLDLFESVTGRTTSTLEMAAMFPWQTIPLLCIFALLCWSSSMRVQLVGVVVVFALVNGTIADRSISVRPVAPLQP
jgi:hypothetical protein